MNRRMRIYPGETGDSNIIGFSASCGVGGDDELGQHQLKRLQDFATERGYTLTDTTPPARSVSYSHYEVRPPLSAEHTREFGALCIGGEISGQPVTKLVDDKFGREYVIVIDNQSKLPEGPYDQPRDTVLAWA